jgi:hypothetical protein
MTSDKSLGCIATKLMEDRKNESRAANYYYKIDHAGQHGVSVVSCRFHNVNRPTNLSFTVTHSFIDISLGFMEVINYF